MAYSRYDEGDNNSVYNSYTNRSANVDARNYSTNNSSALSRMFTNRQSDVDARNYSTSEYNTGGSRIFSYRAGGKVGTFGIGVLSNVIMWLVVFVFLFLAYKILWPLISKWTHLLKPTIDSTVDAGNEEILRHSSDKMSNGYTYWNAAVWLYNQMFSNSWYAWGKSTDHDSVGRYMLTVSPSEYRQLESVYSFYKSSQVHWYQFGTDGTLSDNLMELFSDSEKSKYLSHLSSVL